MDNVDEADIDAVTVVDFVVVQVTDDVREVVEDSVTETVAVPVFVNDTKLDDVDGVTVIVAVDVALKLTVLLNDGVTE